MKYTQRYHQACELQDLMLRDARDDKTTPSQRAQLARAWSELEERKRILRMRPKPKDIDVSKPVKNIQQPTFTE